MATKKPRAPRQPSAPANESKEQKFIRLAKKRAGNAVKHIRNLGKLGSPGYVRTAEQVKKLHDLLTAEVKACVERLTPRAGETRVKEEIKIEL